MNPGCVANLILPPGDTAEEIARDVLAVQQMAAVPTLLEVVCETSGMGFAAVVRVTENTWTACAVQDHINVGIRTGEQLPIENTLCIESKRALLPIVIDHAGLDTQYCNRPMVQRYKIESFVSVPIVTADGRYFGNLCAIHPEPLQVSNPKIVGMFKRFASLIALQVCSEMAREQDQSALASERASSALREQFIAILGHDLRNPLQAILATSELLGRKLTDPVPAAMAARINANAKRMSSLIDDVLDFAQGQLGDGIGIAFDQSNDVESGLHAVVAELQDGQPSRQIISNISVTRSVRCDLGRVQQVVSNLVGNALTHGAPESPVQVNAFADEHDLVIAVSNDGEPIPPDNINRVFEPFWRREAARHREGLGLGLHICSQIVRAHGGKLSVTSTKMTGTQFTVRLPLQFAADARGL